MLGSGAYGVVRVLKVDSETFALKETEISKCPDTPKATHIRSLDEVALIASLREEAMNLTHPHLIQRYWSRFWGTKFQICMELGTPVTHAKPERLLHDICQALYFMHSNGFIHRDVKPDNIVQVGKVYKLIDFGLSRKGDCTQTLTGYTISRWFRPPELLQADTCANYDGRVDMYSLALTVYYLDKGGPLFFGNESQILHMYRNFIPTGIYRHLICDYRFRYTAKQLLDACNITPIEGGTASKKKRVGKPALFVQCLLEGRSTAGCQHNTIFEEL